MAKPGVTPASRPIRARGRHLFIEDEKRFIEAMTDAGKVRIELPKGSGRIPALVFEVAGYDPDRFEKP